LLFGVKQQIMDKSLVKNKKFEMFHKIAASEQAQNAVIYSCVY